MHIASHAHRSILFLYASKDDEILRPECLGQVYISLSRMHRRNWFIVEAQPKKWRAEMCRKKLNQGQNVQGARSVKQTNTLVFLSNATNFARWLNLQLGVTLPHDMNMRRSPFLVAFL